MQVNLKHFIENLTCNGHKGPSQAKPALFLKLLHWIWDVYGKVGPTTVSMMDIYLCFHHSVLLPDLCHHQHDLLQLLIYHVQGFE